MIDDKANVINIKTNNVYIIMCKCKKCKNVKCVNVKKFVLSKVIIIWGT